MTSLKRTTRLFLALVVAAAASAAACRQPVAVAGAREDAARPPEIGLYDVETTDVARVVGGMSPARREAFATLLEMRAWWDYQAESRSRWAAAWSGRLQPLRSWSDAELKKAAGSCQTLLHPFGQTDLLSAYLMFPECEGYVLVGSEPVGQLPSFDDATPAEVKAITDDIRRALPEVFGGGGSGRLGSPAPRRPGALRLLLVQLAQLEARVISASRFDLASNGRPLEAIPIRGGSARPAALSITFELPDGRPQSLVYLPADLDDAAMKRRPAVWTFLRLQAPFTTLLLPAAGLKGERATLLRELVVAQSQAILQDQPAIPSNLLGARRWAVSTLDRPPVGAFGPDAVPTLAVRKGSAAARKR